MVTFSALLTLEVFIISFLLCFGVNAETEKKEVKDCFETINRGVFAFNEGIRKIVFEPLAKGYLYLPSPVRDGAGNMLNNLTNVVTIPNNILQGDFGLAMKIKADTLRDLGCTLSPQNAFYIMHIAINNYS